MKRFGLLVVLLIMATAVPGIFAAGGSGIILGDTFTDINRPVLLTNAGDGTNRLFVVEQAGVIKVIAPGQTAAAEFMDITSKITQIGPIGDERGLLGLAFHPDFASNGFFFVNYTRRSDGATVVERYRAVNNNTSGDAASGVPIIIIAQDFGNHNGGMIEFGADGHLYIGMGDGGSGNDPNNRAQDINSLLGKFLRITPSVAANVGNQPYTNPADNPFVGQAGADEIYAVGLRNPYRWSFDRGGTNQLWAGDVGQFAIEEFNIIEKGNNYGWRVYEGTQCTNNDPGLCNPQNYTEPVSQYARSGGRCSIIGGYVYRGTRGTFPTGAYIYGDYCSGEVWMWHQGQQVLLINTPRNISSFGEDEAGEIYVVGIGGTVEKLINTSNPANDIPAADFDGDGQTDISLFRPSEGVWYIINSSTGAVRIQQFGLENDIPAPADYDGDGQKDIGVFRPADGVWYHFRSDSNTVGIVPFGLSEDIPAAADFDGDGRGDIAVFRPSEGVWYIFRSSDGQVLIAPFGLDGDIPVPADYDGDGTDDLAVFRPADGIWYRINSSNGGFTGVRLGSAGDLPVPGDFDNDNRADPAVFREAEGTWYRLWSTNSAVVINQFGAVGDRTAVGDYDGDRRDDIAYFRPSTGTWSILQSGSGSTRSVQFGSVGDLPAPDYDTP